jgi:predicted MPP superfamily phosphohydrolase
VHTLIRGVLRLSLLHRRGRRNARAIRLRRNEVILSRLPKAFDGYRLLQITDVHLDMADDMAAVLSEAVGRVDYDLCVFTGDLRARTFGPYDKALEQMAQVRRHVTGAMYGILGNHDTIRMVPGLEAMGIRMLLNESVALRCGDAAIWLAGIDDPHFHRADNLEKAVDAIPDSAISILLSHSPEVYRNAAYARFDLMLCGHTHGGQICLPGGVPIMCNADAPRAFCAGAWQYHGLQGYTSAGSGVCVVDVRLNCPPEITLHTLRCG